MTLGILNKINSKFITNGFSVHIQRNPLQIHLQLLIAIANRLLQSVTISNNWSLLPEGKS